MTISTPTAHGHLPTGTTTTGVGIQAGIGAHGMIPTGHGVGVRHGAGVPLGVRRGPGDRHGVGVPAGVRRGVVRHGAVVVPTTRVIRVLSAIFPMGQALRLSVRVRQSTPTAIPVPTTILS